MGPVGDRPDWPLPVSTSRYSTYSSAAERKSPVVTEQRFDFSTSPLQAFPASTNKPSSGNHRKVKSAYFNLTRPDEPDWPFPAVDNTTPSTKQQHRATISGSVSRRKSTTNSNSAAAIDALVTLRNRPSLPAPAPRISFDARHRPSTRHHQLPASPPVSPRVVQSVEAQTQLPIRRKSERHHGHHGHHRPQLSVATDRRAGSFETMSSGSDRTLSTPATSIGGRDDFGHDRAEGEDDPDENVREVPVRIVSPNDWHAQFQLGDDGKKDTSVVRVVTSNDWHDQFSPDQDDGSETATDPCPDRATLAAIQHIPVYDSAGTAHAFGSLYEPAANPRSSQQHRERQLIVFIRHFYCGACQAYLRALATGLDRRPTDRSGPYSTSSDYDHNDEDISAIPQRPGSNSRTFSPATSTSTTNAPRLPLRVIVIGCGQPSMLPYYRARVGGGVPFDLYADPSRRLYRALGLHVNADLGRTPGYMPGVRTGTWLADQVRDLHRGLMQKKKMTKKKLQKNHNKGGGGSELGMGGEALQELEQEQQQQQLGAADVFKGGNIWQLGGEFLMEQGQVVWCHRMRHFRNHAEVPVLRKLLELD